MGGAMAAFSLSVENFPDNAPPLEVIIKGVIPQNCPPPLLPNLISEYAHVNVIFFYIGAVV